MTLTQAVYLIQTVANVNPYLAQEYVQTSTRNEEERELYTVGFLRGFTKDQQVAIELVPESYTDQEAEVMETGWHDGNDHRRTSYGV